MELENPSTAVDRRLQRPLAYPMWTVMDNNKTTKGNVYLDAFLPLWVKKSLAATKAFCFNHRSISLLFFLPPI